MKEIAQHWAAIWLNAGGLVLLFTLAIMPPDRKDKVGTYPWSIIVVGFIGVVVLWPAFVIATSRYAFRLIRDAHRDKGDY